MPDFSAVSFLVAAGRQRDVALWRISPKGREAYESALERERVLTNTAKV